VIDSTRTTIVCDGEAYHGGQCGGQLVVETLLPLNAQIEKVGGSGKECWNEATQRNYAVDMSGSRARGDELGAWRVEVIPSETATDDRFLNVLTAMDVGISAPKVEKLEFDSLIGASAAGHTVLFNKGDEELDQISFELPGSGSCAILVCGVKPGAWSMMGPDGVRKAFDVSEEVGCLFVEGQAGPYRIGIVPE